MKNISTGTGLAIVAAAALAYPFVSSLAPNANASAVTAVASAVSTSASGQTGPTIVWYGVSPPSGNNNSGTYAGTLFRAWSDGRVEYKHYEARSYSDSPCYIGGNACGWLLFSDPAQGLTYRSDINFDSKVDGADLSQVLNDWGNAPRQDIVPSTCPLNLINP